jgi:5-methylcytosine-specific restriction endonuclease McrA
MKDIKKMNYLSLLEYANKLLKENIELKSKLSELQKSNTVELIEPKPKKVYKQNIELKKQYIDKRLKFKKQHIFQHLSKGYIKQGIMLTPLDLWSMAKKQKALCGISGKRLKGQVISLDHIVPKSKGGGDNRENLRLVCFNVNIAKHNFDDKDFLEMCQSVINFNKKN